MLPLNRIARIAQAILFPPLCAHCNTYLTCIEQLLCTTCCDMIQKHTALICPICKKRLPNNTRTCTHSCKKQKQFPYLLGATTNYNDPIIRSCIHRYKYEGMHALAKPLGFFLTEYARSLTPQPKIFAKNPIVTSIPIHIHKEYKRGFNQSEQIAHIFAKEMGFPYDTLLAKVTNTTPQAHIKTYEERSKHMHDTFAVPHPEYIRNRHIIIIDDVSTSGATLSEAAQLMKINGAKQILALVIAKA